MRTVVSPSGVYVCPYHRGNLNMRIGDIGKESFKEMWFGQKRNEVMKNWILENIMAFIVLGIIQTNIFKRSLMVKNLLKIMRTVTIDLFKYFFVFF